MHYELCSEIIGGARALLPMEVYAYVCVAVKQLFLSQSTSDMTNDEPLEDTQA